MFKLVRNRRRLFVKTTEARMETVSSTSATPMAARPQTSGWDGSTEDWNRRVKAVLSQVELPSFK
jgi:hypothetical protein